MSSSRLGRGRLTGPYRGFWRWLTSMRTALLLLLLLAVAAVPGSVFPQRGVSAADVAAYLAAHPGTGPWLDRLGMFDVYASVWFSATYLLLFVSLVGCLVPRLRQHLRALLAAPPDAPARLERLPYSAPELVDTRPPAAVAAEISGVLRRQRWWRTVVRRHDDQTVTVSAEKGYLKETGNLVFHFSLLALLVGVALGSWYGWHGNRLVVAGEDFAFCNNLQQYDESALGTRVEPANLPPFCVTLHDFHAEYLDDGQPIRYQADTSYVDSDATRLAADLGGPERDYSLEVNSPLRLHGANLYLLGHGYAPVLRYTDRYGLSQTAVTPFLPRDAMLSSSGVVKFPDANVDPTGRTPRDLTTQVAFAGLYLPTMPPVADGRLSVYPAQRDPGLTLAAYQGNLGLGSGLPQSVYELDQRQISTGALTKVAETKALRPGEVWTLPDGTSVQFVGTRPWVTVSVRHDPGQGIVLAGAVGLLAGLMVSLAGRRRRVWARVVPVGSEGSVVRLGGLPRGDYPGFGHELDRLAGLVAARLPDIGGR